MSLKEEVPLFKKWSRWYWLLVLVLAALIVFFTWFTRYFA